MKKPLLMLGVLSSLCALACAAPVVSKKPLAAAKPPVRPLAPAALTLDSLAIPAYGSIPSEFTFAGTQKDLLGMVQSLGEGIGAGASKPVSPNMNAAARLFSDADLLGMVKDMHMLQVRSLSFRSRGDEAYDEALKAPVPPAGTTGGLNLSGGDDQYKREQQRLGQAEKFYADAFTKKGGKAQLTLHSDKTSVAVYVFSAPQSFALLTRGPSRVIVARADGLPRLAAIGRLVRQIAVGE